MAVFFDNILDIADEVVFSLGELLSEDFAWASEISIATVAIPGHFLVLLVIVLIGYCVLTCIIHKLSTAMPNCLHTTSVLDFFSLKIVHYSFVEKFCACLYYSALGHLVTKFHE